MARGNKTSGRAGKGGPASPDQATASADLLPSDKLYYRIGEVSDITGVKTYVLRYWESEFRGMVPQKSRSKQRLYKRRDIEMIMLIKKLLYEERYTIAGARQRIKELGVARAGQPDGAVEAEPEGVKAPAAKQAAAGSKQVDHQAEYARIKQDLVNLRAML